MTQTQNADAAPHAQRAQIRSAALREPIESSFTYIRSIPPDAPVVAEGTEAQCLLEGLMLGRIGYFFDPERVGRAAELFVPLAISAGADHYRLTARGDNLVAALHQLTPRWEVGAGRVENGIPGLRWFASERGAGVTFHILGLSARFTVEGISISELERYRRLALLEAGEDSVRGDDALTHQEAASPIRTLKSWWIASIIGRRLGLLLEEGAIAIDSWWNTSDRFTVELIVRDDAPDPRRRILSQLLSPHLAPQLGLDRQIGDHSYLSIEGSTAEIDLRVLRVPAS